MRSAPSRTRTLLLAAAAIVAAVSIAACAGTRPGWTYAPPPSMTPIPSAEPTASAEPSATAAPTDGATAAPSGEPGGTVLQIAALNIEFDVSELTAPADVPFQIEFSNDDPGIPHNVAIRDATGADVFTGDIFNGVEQRTYDVPALPAATYQFVCTVHPNMVGTLTVQ